MITKYLTSVTAKINPFSRRSHAIRVFLSMIPSEARNDIKISTRVVHRLSPSALDIKFKDGKEINVNLKETGVNELVNQVDRHSRMLARLADLSNN